MLQIKGLTKTYKPKKGLPVLAVDHIDLKFPEKGMVFLLGKSGSGKSTMLNLLGGLDVADEGEIIIKGKSSKEFRQQDFDSYRNTYLGFIFQEYNILEEFNVGANIALALQLQGEKATDERINEILKEVDLEGYGNRKPNELSGGQKQRVAIARALVKNPEIIMADEPTGALDSATGRQILDTLKSLSRDKLVIVVSHDRDFAEKYADRIIELADGRILNDVEFEESLKEDAKEDTSEASGNGNLFYGEDELVVSAGYHLTEEDRVAINQWLDQYQRKLHIKMDSKEDGFRLRQAKATDESRILYTSNNDFRLIKSKLPMKNAFKIGVSGLGHKKFKLVMTILLSCVAFGLFGLSDTLGSYDNIKTCTDSILAEGIDYASFSKETYHEEENYSYWSDQGGLTQDDVDDIVATTGIPVAPCYSPYDFDGYIGLNFNEEAEFTETDYHIYGCNLIGFVEAKADMLSEMGAKLVAGSFPDGSKNEIAISTYLVETFKIGGYRSDKNSRDFETISGPDDMIGKTLLICGKEYTITGVFDTGFDLERYKPLIKLDVTATNADLLVQYALNAELRSARSYSLIESAVVGEGFIDRISSNRIKVNQINNGWMEFYQGDYENYFYPEYIISQKDIGDDQIVWAKDAKHEITDKQIVVTEDIFRQYSDQELSEEAVSSLESLKGQWYVYNSDVTEPEIKEIKIVGVIKGDVEVPTDSAVVADEIGGQLATGVDLKYSTAIGAMPKDYSGVKRLVKLCNEGKDGVRYSLNNSVCFELDGLDEIFKELSRIFLGIGIFFAVFASVLMGTFISSSIAYKKQEIGILRAIGARGSDVFRIFFSESFVIAMINFILTSIGTIAATIIINYYVKTRTGLLVKVLSFGPRQLLLLFAVSILVAALASFFPVFHNARKKPIDAIRNR